MPKFTEKQGQYLTYIHLYTRINGRPPAVNDMARFFNVTSPSAQGMVNTLVRKGLVDRTPGAPRTLKVLLEPRQLPALKD